jgi:hypothetical protein
MKSDRDQVFISHHGHPSVQLFSEKGLLLSAGYVRVEFGARGPYVEINQSQIQKANLRKIEAQHSYFDEYRSRCQANVKVYFQRQTVSYAKYKIGFFYISPFELYDDKGRPVAGELPTLFDGLSR